MYTILHSSSFLHEFCTCLNLVSQWFFSQGIIITFLYIIKLARIGEDFKRAPRVDPFRLQMLYYRYMCNNAPLCIILDSLVHSMYYTKIMNARIKKLARFLLICYYLEIFPSWQNFFFFKQQQLMMQNCQIL